MSQIGLALLRRSLTHISQPALENDTGMTAAEPPTPGKEAQSVDDIARICHEACRAASAADGDTERPTWANAPQWQKDATRKGVIYIQQHPDAPPGALQPQQRLHSDVYYRKCCTDGRGQ